MLNCQKRISYLMLILLPILNCYEIYKGTPLPLGDEFEDYWTLADWDSSMIIDILASKDNDGTFFILSERRIFHTQTNYTEFNEIFSGKYMLTCIDLFLDSQTRLLVGTDTSLIFLLRGPDFTPQKIFIPELNGVYFVLFHPSDTNIFYAGDSNNLLYTGDMGISFDTIFCSGEFIKSFKTDPAGNLYVVTSSGLLRSTDQGADWQTVYQSSEISEFCIDQKGDIYISLRCEVKKSSDQGQNWQNCFSIEDNILTFIPLPDYLIVVYNSDGLIKLHKIFSDFKKIDMSYGIIYGDYGDIGVLLRADGNYYLFCIKDYDYGEFDNSIIFYFLDTLLPP